MALQPIENRLHEKGLHFASDASGSSLSKLAQSFSERISELKQFMHLRVADVNSSQAELQGLEASVRAVEKHVAELKAYMKSERAAIPKVEALLSACRLQEEDLKHMAVNLPPHLPSLPQGAIPAAAAAAAGAGRPSLHPSAQSMAFAAGLVGSASSSSLAGSADALGGAAARSALGASTRGDAGDAAVERRRPGTAAASAGPVPRWYVSEPELQSVGSYLRGRLTLDKVNSAVDEIAAHAEANARLMAAAKSGGSKLNGPDRKRATDLLHNVAGKEGVKGYHWFIEPDLKEGAVVKLDKSGKNMLTLLRHLGRLHEVRCNTEGGSVHVYVLEPHA